MINTFQKISFNLLKFACSTAKNVKKQSTSPKMVLINENLRFDADEYHLYLAPKHPKIIKKGLRSAEIDTESEVLTFDFLKKHNNQEDITNLWQSRSTFSFKFQQLHKILDIQPGVGKKVYFTHQQYGENEYGRADYCIADLVQSKQIEFRLRKKMEKDETEVNQKQFKTRTNYSQFETIQLIIRESIYDLSGLRLIMDIKRAEEIEQFKKNLNAKSSKEEEVEEFYPQK